jgi:tetratricopeptide (TPR) repeat protein
MAFKDIFKITRQTKILFVFVACISVLCFIVAYFYYDYKNKSEDPRIIDARMKLDKFDKLMKERKYTDALPLLDTINTIYRNAKGYEGSFEFGVVYNNRGTIYLSMAIYDSLINKGKKDTLLLMAEEEINKSIVIYKHWIDSVGAMKEEQIRKNIKPSFNENDAGLKGKNLERIIEKRVEDIVFAQTETPRRLSVSYTNLGIVQRHQYKQADAMQSYIEALKLWKDNFTARNNLNVLMGKPPEDRSIIDQLFPPDRSKKD